MALFGPWGASHLRARCARCDHTSDASCSRPLRRPSTAPPSPTSWLGANLACLLLLSASLGRGLKMPFSSTSFCSILCVAVPFFSACGGRAENSSRCQHAARIRVVRGSTRRSLLWMKAPFFKELFVRRRKRSLQLHVMLLPHTAQLSNLLLRLLIVRLAAAAYCCWHREL